MKLQFNNNCNNEWKISLFEFSQAERLLLPTYIQEMVFWNCLQNQEHPGSFIQKHFSKFCVEITRSGQIIENNGNVDGNINNTSQIATYVPITSLRLKFNCDRVIVLLPQ